MTAKLEGIIMSVKTIGMTGITAEPCSTAGEIVAMTDLALGDHIIPGAGSVVEVLSVKIKPALRMGDEFTRFRMMTGGTTIVHQSAVIVLSMTAGTQSAYVVPGANNLVIGKHKAVGMTRETVRMTVRTAKPDQSAGEFITVTELTVGDHVVPQTCIGVEVSITKDQEPKRMGHNGTVQVMAGRAGHFNQTAVEVSTVTACTKS